ncbi:MAG: type III secretion system export apparatus subunit SctU [Vulcanimicrobiaceae bacterium]
MSEQQGEKNFEPTQSRIDKAKRDGDVPRSTELSGALAFGAGVLGVVLALPNLASLARTSLTTLAAHPLHLQKAQGLIEGMALWTMAPIVCAAVAGSSAMIVQSGGVRLTAVTTKLNRLSSLEGLKRMFSRESFVNAIRAVVAVGCVVATLAPTVVQVLTAGVGSTSLSGLAALAWDSALRCALVIAVLGMLFGGLDFAMLFARWHKKLKMSFDEIKRDNKEQDGDPIAKGRRRSMHRDISRSSLKRVKAAAFVVVNPTHIAIALQYHPPEVAVPRVLIRAADEAALRVREAAVEYNIPIIENIPLARSLYASVKAGEVIPKDSYIAIAEIVAALSKSGAIS